MGGQPGAAGSHLRLNTTRTVAGCSCKHVHLARRFRANEGRMDMKQVYICHDTITGIFSAIHDAWKENRDGDSGIALRGVMIPQLFCEYIEVEETIQKSIAVERLIKKNLGYNAYWDLYHALLSDDCERADAVYHTMLEARKVKDSKKIMEHLSNPHVAKVFELSRKVANEAHFFTEFIRFRELENGVMLSEITPKGQVLTCIADHFTNRFPLEHWMVYDKTHRVFLVHQARKNWVLVQGEILDTEAAGRISEAEEEFANLWKGFCKSISIEERENLNLQRNHLPIRFRQNMTEF
ncbi:probable DNA metabolism protein [Faecalicatena contorta]|uniref:Probable DNA metabolism protein n=2 Tax=Faecalicatena contorta TaxID=39482 RepID=A0A316ALI3_9FIRM|nr:putative DNA metabolism protein [Faecalicatena contorta]SUQ13455.1 probable DNA metabolism protein [Faecalicatena contorta]